MLRVFSAATQSLALSSSAEHDTELLAVAERLGAGDCRAFDVVVHTFWEPVMRFLWKRVPADDAQDLAQSVFANAFRAVLAGAGPQPSDRVSWRRYLLAGARNQWIDQSRRAGAATDVLSLDEPLGDEACFGELLADARTAAPSPERLISLEQAGALRECMSRLEPRERAMCWLHYIDGLSKREIARSLARPEATVRTWLDKTLATLRACLSSKGHAP